MSNRTLSEWLQWMETLHPTEIELGLERVLAVRHRLGLGGCGFPLIVVAGTNGKGSCVAMLEAILTAAGYRTGCYTSPHLLRYNERVRIEGRPVSDQALCRAFERVEAARGTLTPTYFELGTLAAMETLYSAAPDAAILEVGLGGRLDAVNAWDADAALVTSVDIDHQAWLGEDREAIGREKAGIFRPGRPAVCADPDPPRSLVRHAEALSAPLFRFSTRAEAGASGFGYRLGTAGDWSFIGPHGKRHALPMPGLRGAVQLRNAAAVVMVLECLRGRLPVSQRAVRDGLAGARLAGRFQVLPGSVPWVLDVAHNPEAARVLAENLRAWPVSGRTRAVLGMLEDKDAGGVIAAMAEHIDGWYVTDLHTPRAARAAVLRRCVEQTLAHPPPVTEYPRLAEALAAARRDSRAGDRILVFGSFYTVAEALQELGESVD